MNERTHANGTTPATFKRKAMWEGIRLEHYRLPAGELPFGRDRSSTQINRDLG